MATVIIGAGVIGLSTAHALSLPDSSTDPPHIHIVECSPTLFASASGNAGGFLARDWFMPATAALGALSFDMHQKLAQQHAGRAEWGYCKCKSISLEPQIKAAGKSGNGHDWIGEGVSRRLAAGHSENGLNSLIPSWLVVGEDEKSENIADERTTAVIDPRRFCHFLLDQCRERGVNLHHPAEVVSVRLSSSGELDGVNIRSASGDIAHLRCRRIVVAAGAWSSQVLDSLFPSQVMLPVTALAGHSIVVRDSSQEGDPPTTCAVFADDDESEEGERFAPEMFRRVGGEIFLGGLNSSTLPLPRLATESQTQTIAVARLEQVARRRFGPGVQVIRSAVCYRPVTPSGKPIIAQMPGLAGGCVFVGVGHGPWGISMSLATGKVLADMVEGREPSVNVSELGL